MSRETSVIYHCDKCRKTLSSDEGDVRVPHLSIIFGGTHRGLSGWVEPTDDIENTWEFTKPIPDGIYQFCDVSCLSGWINKYIRD